MKSRTAVILALLALSAPYAAGQTHTSRARFEREWEVKARKMERYLLPTMRKHGVDMWILLSRENAPDPLLDLFGAYGISGWYGHRNAYVFFDPGGTESLEATAIGTHLSEHLKRFYQVIVPYGEEGLAKHLGSSSGTGIRKRSPLINRRPSPWPMDSLPLSRNIWCRRSRTSTLRGSSPPSPWSSTT